MLRHCVILALSLAAAWAVPQASSKAELQRLARLPKIEFAPPLQFDRKAGFVVFPDSATATSAAAKLLADSKGLPIDAPKFLKVAGLLEANGDFGTALKSYARAADLYRKRVEIEPGSASDLAGLAEALLSIGRATEAQAQLDKALSLAPEKPEIVLAAARFYQERAWQALAGEQRLFSASSFLDSASELLGDPPTPARIAEALRFLERAATTHAKLANLKDQDDDARLQRATFLAFRGAVEELLRQAQADEAKVQEVRKRLFSSQVLDALAVAADRAEDSPSVLAAAAFAMLFGETLAHGLPENPMQQAVWPQLSVAMQARLREYCSSLERLAAEGSEQAAVASEFLGCVQLYVLRDVEGAGRSFRQALLREGRRHRSWDLLVLASATSNDPADLVEICHNRLDAMPTARSSVFLAKAYDRAGDETRAELVCVAALAAHQNDFLLNLSLASLLLKRPNAEQYLWRVQDLIKKAEKNIPSGASALNHLNLALTKSIYLALSDKPAEARAALERFSSRPSVPTEVEEILRVLNR